MTTLESSVEPSSSLDHRLKISASLFDILSGRTNVDHPLCQECADVLLAAKQQSLEYQEEELNCLRSYLNYLDARADSKLDNWTSSLGLVIDTDSCAPPFNLCEPPPENQSDADESDYSDPDNATQVSVSDQDQEPKSKEEGIAALTKASGSPSEEQHFVLTDSVSPVNADGALHDSKNLTTSRQKRQPRLTQLRDSVNELQRTLDELLNEGKDLDQQLAKATADLEYRMDELDKAQTQYNEQKQTLLDSTNELLSLESRVADAESHLQRLARTNVLNTTFPIWYDGHIGVINGLHLGRLSNRPIAWEEINAAWGQCAMLLQCIIRRLNFQFPHYEIIPMGIRSKIVEIQSRREHPLYYVTNIFSQGKFNAGMAIFLKCVGQVQQVVESNSNAQLPYQVKSGGKIHDPQDGRTYSITWSKDSEEDWTKALKMMLINLKWIIARLATIDV
ncbi:unnamed protein product [Echinostoma caproni]|uniref:Atg6 BARA domain-containing protein n=1 Tax=Echinostoma caproni TaxID=27848 RepID=A0A3P8FM44_9TREM|nr:unnamed protein product [Echinostoma caproni]